MDFKLSEGSISHDIFPIREEETCWAGIHVGNDINVIKCFSNSEEGAKLIRKNILDCVQRCAQIDETKMTMRELSGITELRVDVKLDHESKQSLDSWSAERKSLENACWRAGQP